MLIVVLLLFSTNVLLLFLSTFLLWHPRRCSGFCRCHRSQTRDVSCIVFRTMESRLPLLLHAHQPLPASPYFPQSVALLSSVFYLLSSIFFLPSFHFFFLSASSFCLPSDFYLPLICDCGRTRYCGCARGAEMPHPCEDRSAHVLFLLK